jgi:hypothetical protein
MFLKSFRFDPAVEGAGGGGNPAGGSEQPWYSTHIPAEATYDQGGKAVPIRDLDAIKQVKDIPTLAKSYLDSQSEIGRRVRIPGKEAKEEERRAFANKLTETGFLPALPEGPDKYEIAKPEHLADGVFWNDELAGKAKQFFHDSKMTQEQAAKATAFFGEAIAGMAQVLKVSADEAKATLQKEWGGEFEDNMKLVGRAADFIFAKNPTALEKFNASGLLNDPDIARTFHLVAKHLEPADGFQPSGSDGSAGADDPQAEAERIMRDPKHPEHEAWKNGDPKVIEKIRGLFMKKYPEQQQA